MNILFGKPIVNFLEKKRVKSVLESGRYVHGNETIKFEKSFQKFTKSKYAITVSSCTAGMHLFYLALGIKQGDEVIVPSQTHVSAAHAIEIVGAKPIFVDCELETGNIDISLIEKHITKKTKAICIVHFLGIPVDMIKVKKIAKKHKLFLLEDCALSLGSKINNKHVGLFGDAGVFSFYPVKHITTAEGGIVITKNKKIYSLIKSLKAFGVDKSYNQRNVPGKYDVKYLGLNYRMSEIHAAIGNEQLKKLKKFLKIRKRNFNYLYKKISKFNKIFILKNNQKNFTSSNYCMSIIFKKISLEERIKIITLLNSKGIGTSIYYPKPIPHMTYYKKKYSLDLKKFPKSSKISYQSIALPVGPHLELNNLDFIIKFLKKICISN